jgi:hypothetical protein
MTGVMCIMMVVAAPVAVVAFCSYDFANVPTDKRFMYLPYSSF